MSNSDGFIQWFIHNPVCITIALLVVLSAFTYLCLLKVRKSESSRSSSIEREAPEPVKQTNTEYERRLSEISAAIAECPGSEKYRLSEWQNEASSPMLNITQFTPISKKRYVAFDLETTGLSSAYDSIVEIGAVLVENGVITKEYHRMINPGKPIPAEASAVNHITDDMLYGQPKIHQVLPSFLAFVGDDILAAHNAAFDAKFVIQACLRNKFRIPVGFFDTMRLAQYWPESPDKKLSSLIEAAGLNNDEAHRALSDARAVAELISATNQRRSESRKSSNKE